MVVIKFCTSWKLVLWQNYKILTILGRFKQKLANIMVIKNITALLKVKILLGGYLEYIFGYYSDLYNAKKVKNVKKLFNWEKN